MPRKPLSSRLRRNLALPLAGTMAATLATLKMEPKNLPTVFLVGSAWAVSARNRVADSDVSNRIHSGVKELAPKVDSLDMKMSQSAINAVGLDTIRRAISQNHRDIRDVAGSVVRNLKLSRGVAERLGVDISASFPKGAPVEKTTAAVDRSDSGRREAKPEVTSNSTLSELPDSQPIARPVSFSNIRVAVIADEFTIESFRFEWDIVTVTKESWRREMDESKPDFLFVESAWEGNAGNWRYQLVGSAAPRAEIVELVEYCNANGIPTAFWNKEDPPHFEDFLKTASLFDFIFTTEEALIAEYQERTGNSDVYLLPFAAQPAIHNPVAVRNLARSRPVVFGGMYFREKYPERRDQMDRLLPAAGRVGLDIYSRNSGEDIRYRYPDSLVTFVRGSLQYSQMLSAYHAYKVVINVNSVVGSNSMCARRIFEATACGAAVVTEPTPAIERYFPGDLLTQIEDESTAYHAIRSLVRSDEYRDRKVLVAQREIWRRHTYTHRAETVMKAMGIQYSSSEKAVSFFVSTNRPQNLRMIFENVARQSISEWELLIAAHGFQPSEETLAELSSEFGVERFRVIPISKEKSLGFCLNTLVRESSGDILLRMDDDDFYGRWYAEDMVHALNFSQADLVGKAATYIYFEEMDATVLTFPGKENRITDFVRGATFGGPRKTFVNYPFPEQSQSEDSSVLNQLRKDKRRIYCTDRFNYAVMRNVDKRSHTWQVEDISLFGTGEMKFMGFDPKQVEV